jgi:LuxR family maltose regulon positive regulatory protein
MLLKARFHLVQGHAQAAHALLLHLLAEIPESEHSRVGLSIQVLLALTEATLSSTSSEDHNKQISAARRRLHTVLSLAQPQGFLRLFLDEGEPMEKLLHSVASHLHEPALKTYVQQLLRDFGSASTELTSSPLPESLSPQEVRVLRLLASGSSAPQIAQHLVVSVTTVRTQIQSIYRKLQVNNRVAASSAARALHLL